MSENRSASRNGFTGKRVILVNGIPASGKSRLAVELSAYSGWLQLSLDGIKNPFLQRLENVDRPFNRMLGQASYQVIWDIIAGAPDGSTFIVDAWFGFQPREVLQDYLQRAGVTQVLEVWCQIHADLAAQRFSSRLGERLPGHVGAEYIPELKILAGNARPMSIGPVYSVDQNVTAQNKPVNIVDIHEWIMNSFDTQIQ
ncbi:AAA family ATPase [Rahnella woolbedingensis]|uniref:AAA family ATPase n=1 Tax=Rahnella woolbedingensis TaxID=1510574 RepID=A0A419NAS5_9GAMM|nr:AAA family ATPase [Rahnella woolbedingensis]RJT45118.1 AAA family ATPase [Rahnella woolbedingensis]